VLFALVSYFARTLGVEAVVPPPNGGYPNFTTAEGTKAIFNLTSGSPNTAVGWFSHCGPKEISAQLEANKAAPKTVLNRH